jgi:hypothetical protein
MRRRERENLIDFCKASAYVGGRLNPESLRELHTQVSLSEKEMHPGRTVETLPWILSLSFNFTEERTKRRTAGFLL